MYVYGLNNLPTITENIRHNTSNYNVQFTSHVT